MSSIRQQWLVPPAYSSVPESDVEVANLHKGKLKVVGLLTGPTARGRYVVRCDCGNYELRRRRALLNSKNEHDCCFTCQTTHRLLAKSATAEQVVQRNLLLHALLRASGSRPFPNTKELSIRFETEADLQTAFQALQRVLSQDSEGRPS